MAVVTAVVSGVAMIGGAAISASAAGKAGRKADRAANAAAR